MRYFKYPIILNLIISTCLIAFSGQVTAQDDLERLRQQLEQQQLLIEQQQKMLKTQQQQIDQQMQELNRLSQRMSEVEHNNNDESSHLVASSEDKPGENIETASTPDISKDDTTVNSPLVTRDAVGDLNAEAVSAGDFPGSIKIPGTRDVSLAIGGFIKAVALFDSDAETMGSDFIPATLGTRRPDTDGVFSLDATLTRLNLDARAPVLNGQLRGYVEADLNDTNDGSLGVKMRHAYGSWTTATGTLLAGHTWSTLMDLKILPEGLTEPTVSGVIFNRQAQVRWSQSFNPQWSYHIALEDPGSNDFSSSIAGVRGNTSYPDGVLGLEYSVAGTGHLRLNGIVRHLEVDGLGVSDSATAWGASLTGHLDIYNGDKLHFSSIYGEGLGRYLLGIQSTSGSVVNPVSGSLALRDNWGVMGDYLHQWTDNMRSSLMVGHARSETFGWQPGSTFENTTYVATNLMWSPYPYLTFGIEYGYGELENADGSSLDNHRVGLGMQIY